MDVSSLFIANAQATKLIQPCKGSFDHPAISTQIAAVLGVSFGEQRYDMADTKALPDSLRVITPVAYHAIRTMPWASAHSLQGWKGVDEYECSRRIVSVGAGKLDDQWHALTVAD